MDDEVIYFWDTNAASAFAKQRDRRLVAMMEQHLPQLRLSSIVWAELEYGAYKQVEGPTHRDRLLWLRKQIVGVESFDEKAANAAGELRAYFERLKPNAEPIGKMDCLIAGHALSRGAVVVTHNVDEFERVPTLRVEDWQTVR